MEGVRSATGSEVFSNKLRVSPRLSDISDKGKSLFSKESIEEFLTEFEPNLTSPLGRSSSNSIDSSGRISRDSLPEYTQQQSVDSNSGRLSVLSLCSSPHEPPDSPRELLRMIGNLPDSLFSEKDTDSNINERFSDSDNTKHNERSKINQSRANSGKALFKSAIEPKKGT